MDTLKEVVLYFSGGKNEIPILSYIDDKKATKEEKKQSFETYCSV